MGIPIIMGVTWLYITGVTLIGGTLIALNIFAIKITSPLQEKHFQGLVEQRRQWEDHVGAGQRTSSLTGSITSGKA